MAGRSDEDEVLAALDQTLSDDNDISGSDSDCEVSEHESGTDETADEEVADGESESSNFFYGKNRMKWSKKQVIRGRIPQHNIIPRCHLPGIKGEARQTTATSPLAFWKLLFTDEILEEIVLRTNERIISVTEDINKLSYHCGTDLAELKALLGLCYLWGAFKSNDEDLLAVFAKDGTGRPIFRGVMPYNRVFFLLRCLRFDDPKTREQRKQSDKLAHISWLFQKFIERCQLSYSVGQYVTIDEMLVGFRGRCSFRMYIPSKPRKYGIKIFILTDAKLHYCLNAEVYCGRTVGQQSTSKSGLLVPTSVVLRLAKPIQGSNRNITGDNWFTSIELVNELSKMNLTYVGTINKRELPPAFINSKGRGVSSCVHGFSGKLTLVSFVPKKGKVVNLISTMHHSQETDPSTGKPVIIMDYNQTKGGVDALDEKCHNYSTGRRTRRWPMAIFYALLDIAGVNAYVLFNGNSQTHEMDRRNFLVQLGKELVDEHMRRRLQAPKLRKDVKESIQTILGIEQELSQPSTSGESTPVTKSKRKRCSICPPKTDRKTFHECVKCQVPLCVQCGKMVCPKCFERNINN